MLPTGSSETNVILAVIPTHLPQTSPLTDSNVTRRQALGRDRGRRTTVVIVPVVIVPVVIIPVGTTHTREIINETLNRGIWVINRGIWVINRGIWVINTIIVKIMIPGEDQLA